MFYNLELLYLNNLSEPISRNCMSLFYMVKNKAKHPLTLPSLPKKSRIFQITFNLSYYEEQQSQTQAN